LVAELARCTLADLTRLEVIHSRKLRFMPRQRTDLETGGRILTHRDDSFVDGYIDGGGSATGAAVQAGYSANYADREIYELLVGVAAFSSESTGRFGSSSRTPAGSPGDSTEARCFPSRAPAGSPIDSE
jgi:hypothetical protein